MNSVFSKTCHVTFQFGDRRFPLEAVKQLKKLMDLDDFNASPHLAETSVAAVCTDPLLPQVFRPVCHGKGAALTLSRLGRKRMKNTCKLNIRASSAREPLGCALYFTYI